MARTAPSRHPPPLTPVIRIRNPRIGTIARLRNGPHPATYARRRIPPGSGRLRFGPDLSLAWWSADQGACGAVAAGGGPQEGGGGLWPVDAVDGDVVGVLDVPDRLLGQRPVVAVDGQAGAEVAPGVQGYLQCGRELCALACVDMSGSRQPSRSSDDDFPAPWHQPTHRAAEGSCKWPAGACLRRSSEIRKSARRSQRQARRPGRWSPGPRDGAARCRGLRVPAFQRRGLWLDQASVRRALAVLPRGRSDASTTATMSSRCSPGPSVRSRRLPGAAA
jgi:hypothetical protein